MELTDKNFEAIFIAGDVFNCALKLIVEYGYGSELLTVKPLNCANEYQRAWLNEVAEEALRQCAEVVESYGNEGFSVDIMGIPGAYYIEAEEYDETRLFETLQEAREAVRNEFGNECI
jgi:hypothetical protein